MTSIDKRFDLALPQPRSYTAARAAELASTLMRGVPWGICTITAIAAALRLAELEDVAGNPFYDAAVRSMGMSWHNFLFGAFDPGAMLSVDKPPLDLWLQVASTKLLGWNSVALKLPEVLGGTLAVPLLYDAVRRAAGRGAGLAAAASLAVMPVSVLTARSDTMDSLMMLFIVAALWLVVRATAAPAGGRRWLLLSGVAFGLAFNVKLLEALIALPALMVLYAVGAQVPVRRRVADLAVGAAALVAVSLSWAIAITLAPGRHPFAIGSSSGDVLNVIFGFNGVSRLAGTMTAGGTFAAPPGGLRLLSGIGGIGQLFGVLLVAGLAFLAAAALVDWRGRAAAADPRPRRLALAFALAMLVWVVSGVGVLSYVSVFHARYLEAVAPAVAAALGCGVASLVGGALRGGGGGGARPPAGMIALIPLLAAALAGVCWYTSSVGSAPVGFEAALATAAVCAATASVFVPRAARTATWLAGALALACCLSFPVKESVRIVRSGQSDSVGLAVHPPAVEASISRYLRHRTRGLRYELAVDDPLALAPLIIHDARPILPLTSFGAKPLVGLAALRRAARSGQVRFALVGSYRCTRVRKEPGCVRAALWVRRHGTDVSAQAGIPPTLPLELYRLSR